MKPQNSEENANKCSCPNCALYNDCTKKGDLKLFCSRGKTECEMDANKMCICGSCPVFAENNLSGAYFCIHGEAK